MLSCNQSNSDWPHLITRQFAVIYSERKIPSKCFFVLFFFLIAFLNEVLIFPSQTNQAVGCEYGSVSLGVRSFLMYRPSTSYQV